MRSRGRRVQEEDSSQGWLMSYGDMMSLLLCFFILIVSYSVVELIKFRQAMGSLRGARGVLMEETGQKVVETEARSIAERPLLKKELMMFATLSQKARTLQAGEQKGVEILVTSNGVRFRISSPLLFEAGEVELKPSVHVILSEIAKLVEDYMCEVRVEGHTDDIPIHTDQFPSNWELSAARAMAVVKYFVNREKLDPTRLWIAGYGEHRPVAPNDTPTNRAKNRRVEIFLNWEDTFDLM